MKLAKLHPRHACYGGALVPALLVVTLVAALGAGLIGMQTAITKRHAHGVDLKRALYAAEAGVAEAFAALTVGKSGEVGTPEQPAKFGRALYFVEATPTADGDVLLHSTGLAGSARFSVEAVVRPGENPAANNGVFGRHGITIGEGAVVDGYDSTAGTYAEQIDPSNPAGATGGGARLTSNRDIVLQGGLEESGPTTAVFGDVRPGPEYVVQSDPGVHVSGSTMPLTEKAAAPSIPVPEIATSQGSVTASGELTGPELRYDTLRVQSGETLRLTGPLRVVVDALEVDGRLELDGGAGEVEVFVLQTFRLRNRSQLETVSASPRGVGIFLGAIGAEKSNWDSMKRGEFSADGGEAQAVFGLAAPEPAEPALVFQPTGTFRGLLYAPFVDLTVPASLRVFGAVGAKNATLAPGARVSFDEGLITADLGLVVLPELVSWKIGELPDEPIVTSRVDPFVQLQLAGVTPLDSAQAHRETWWSRCTSLV